MSSDIARHIFTIPRTNVVWLTVPVQGSAMKKVNLESFYGLGKDLSLIPFFREGVPVQRVYDAILTALPALVLIENDSLLKLTVCKDAARKLITFLESYLEFDEDGIPWLADNPYRKLADREAKKIRDAFAEFEVVLKAELRSANSYLFPQIGIYSVDSLLGSADEMFGEEIRALLSAKVVRDLREAGKSLVSDLFTACAFHLFRAIEGVMEDYVTLFHGSLGKESDRNWGKFIQWLRDAGANPTVTSKLDKIRDEHRNPTMHPEIEVKKDGALALLGDTQTVILLMISDMERKRNPTSPLAGMIPQAPTKP